MAEVRYWLRYPRVVRVDSTDLCGECGHCRDRHTTAPTAPLCMVTECACVGGHDWRRAIYISPG